MLTMARTNGGYDLGCAPVPASPAIGCDCVRQKSSGHVVLQVARNTSSGTCGAYSSTNVRVNLVLSVATDAVHQPI